MSYLQKNDFQNPTTLQKALQNIIGNVPAEKIKIAKLVHRIILNDAKGSFIDPQFDSNAEQTIKDFAP